MRSNSTPAGTRGGQESLVVNDTASITLFSHVFRVFLGPATALKLDGPTASRYMRQYRRSGPGLFVLDDFGFASSNATDDPQRSLRTYVYVHYAKTDNIVRQYAREKGARKNVYKYNRVCV